jgi:hypothetical protein
MIYKRGKHQNESIDQRKRENKGKLETINQRRKHQK